MRRCYRNQSGLAIITVLLIVALMVTLLGFLVEQQHMLTRRLGNQFVAEQGYQYVTGVDQWAARILHDDLDRSIDSWQEPWSKFGDPPELDEETSSFSLDSSSQKEEEPLPTIDFGIDGLDYKIIDLQARYNLNNLAIKNEQIRRSQRTIFLNLLGLLEIGDYAERDELAGALVDWLDEGDGTTDFGAESPDYLAAEVPYYSADRKLTSLGELRYVRGFTDEIIQALAPHVTVLPIDNARININTTSTEVLTATHGNRSELDTSSVSAFLAQREDESFLGFTAAQIQEAQNAIIGAVPYEGSFVANMLQANSQFFEVQTQVTLGQFRYCSYSTLFRENAQPDAQSTPKVTVLHRHYNTICDEIVR